MKFLSEANLDLFEHLAALAEQVDRSRNWPVQSLALLKESEIIRWGIPLEYGGQEVTADQSARMYLDLSAACLTTAFILSQRNAAIQRLVACDHLEIKQQLLPELASGRSWTTVGISHLSTSRQHLRKPAVVATETDDGYIFDGFVPWVTGAEHADFLLLGGVLADGRQLLATLPRQTPGIEYGPSAEMLSLTASCTGNLQLHQVPVPDSTIVAGPVFEVMKSGGGGTGSLTTSLITTGVALRAVSGFRLEAAKRPELQAEYQQLQVELDRLVQDLLNASNPNIGAPASHNPASIRTRANSVVLRAAQAYLTATKGSGFQSGHPAERTIREAMFFLVWSCPAAVAHSAIKEFACPPEFV